VKFQVGVGVAEEAIVTMFALLSFASSAFCKSVWSHKVQVILHRVQPQPETVANSKPFSQAFTLTTFNALLVYDNQAKSVSCVSNGCLPHNNVSTSLSV
jgi:hypothetical protein